MNLVRRCPHSIRQSKPARVQRPTNDYAFDTVLSERRKLANIVQVRHAARSDDGNLHGLGDLRRLGQIDSGAGAVSTDVGVDDTRGAVAFTAPGQFDCAHRRGFLPTLDRYLALARVDADNDFTGKLVAQRA